MIVDSWWNYIAWKRKQESCVNRGNFKKCVNVKFCRKCPDYVRKDDPGQ